MGGKSIVYLRGMNKVAISELEHFVKFVKVNALRCLNFFSLKVENYSQYL